MDGGNIWFGIIVVLGIAEAVMLRLTFLWFAIGALIGLILWALGCSVPVQIIAFTISSIVLFATTKPLVAKYRVLKAEKDYCDRLVYKHAVVIEPIGSTEQPGKISVLDQEWPARPEKVGSFSVGETVRILRIEGDVALVEPIEDEEE